MTTAVILQARMQSTRLPGKILYKAGKRTILEWVIRACSRIPGVDVVCCAVPDGEANEPVVSEAKRCGAVVTRGSEFDVLDRFKLAAESLKARVIVRITTDCPLTDPTIDGQVLALLAANDIDYACNNEPFSFPHGLDCEAFTREALERAASLARLPYEREHVTPWLKTDPSIRRANLHGPGGDFVHWRWTIDCPEDLDFVRSVVNRLGDNISNWIEVSQLLHSHPELHELNMNCRQR